MKHYDCSGPLICVLRFFFNMHVFCHVDATTDVCFKTHFIIKWFKATLGPQMTKCWHNLPNAEVKHNGSGFLGKLVFQNTPIQLQPAEMTPETAQEKWFMASPKATGSILQCLILSASLHHKISRE